MTMGKWRIQKGGNGFWYAMQAASGTCKMFLLWESAWNYVWTGADWETWVRSGDAANV